LQWEITFELHMGRQIENERGRLYLLLRAACPQEILMLASAVEYSTASVQNVYVISSVRFGAL
jgi:hypothetical protein